MKNTAAFWDRIAPKYARRPISDLASYERTLERTRSYLTSEDRVLELGCGTGSTALLLADGVQSYIASDVAPGMIAEAEAKRTAQTPQGFSFVVGDWTSGALDGPHDAVLAFNLLHLIDDLPAVLERVHGVLRPGGLFISKTACAPANGGGVALAAIKLLVRVMQAFGKAPFVAFRTTSAHDAAIEAAGFEILEAFDRAGKIPARYVVARRI